MIPRKDVIAAAEAAKGGRPPMQQAPSRVPEEKKRGGWGAQGSRNSAGAAVGSK